ncbi:hypothetical protein [Hyphococcus sp.]|uniref:hypothetical protein n=1 Tax=Hyphococcus sp. TaxID=2038636 RepID=UPI0020834B8D|nr:MAG: hypothetical protein DHS20C04_16990 [Marinicaulis sp.]
MGKTLHSAVLCAFIFAGACAREDLGQAKYALDQCRRVALVDEASGDSIRGAEDLALDAERGLLFVSAYDRLAVEKSARQKRDALPQGGVYAISFDKIFDPETHELRLESLAAPADFPGGLHPHGIDYDAQNKELVFVNRTYERKGRKWLMVPRLQRIGANGEMFVGAAAPAHCSANDIVATDAGTFTSFDHASCGVGGGFENLFRLKRSGVASEAGPVFSHAAFANGLAQTTDGELVVAATRESAILFLEKEGDALAERARIKLPGRPDNLTIANDGNVVAALHPSMPKLTAARKFGIGKSPSRIVKASPATDAVTLLFDDPKASLFSAATAAVETDAGLVAGSVVDDGLLVCQSDSRAVKI